MVHRPRRLPPADVLAPDLGVALLEFPHNGLAALVFDQQDLHPVAGQEVQVAGEGGRPRRPPRAVSGTAGSRPCTSGTGRASCTSSCPGRSAAARRCAGRRSRRARPGHPSAPARYARRRPAGPPSASAAPTGTPPCVQAGPRLAERRRPSSRGHRAAPRSSGSLPRSASRASLTGSQPDRGQQDQDQGRDREHAMADDDGQREGPLGREVEVGRYAPGSTRPPRTRRAPGSTG